MGSSKSFVYGGHSMDGKGYEPIPSMTLDSLLSYIQTKYVKEFWVTSFGNIAMYEFLNNNVSFAIEGNCVTIDISKVKDKIERFGYPQAILTMKFKGVNLDFYSEGLENNWYEKGDSYANIDLRKSNKLYFKPIM